MKIGILKEKEPETRVAMLPEHIAGLKKLGFETFVEHEAGQLSFASNQDYHDHGAIVKSRNEIIKECEVLLCINPLENDVYAEMNGKLLIGNFFPLVNKDVVHGGSNNNVTIFSLDMLPRTTRAQSMDVLSSQANIAGYKAVLMAADRYPRYFPMFMTAAGSIPPAKLLILGAGVAGLQALATARRLGAVVEVFDTRPAVKEEVMSLGGKFVEVEGAADPSQAGGYAVEQSEAFLQKQKERIAQSVAKTDIIITTAQIPGKKAPILITEEMIASMKSGSVIVDLAAMTGGNTPYTVSDDTVIVNNVTIIGNSYLARTLPSDASKVYGKNMLNFLALLIDKEGKYWFNENDELVRGACVTKDSMIYNERLK